jgi:hypothetical protein
MADHRSPEIVLRSSTASALLIERRASGHLAIGVPHHAPAGVGTLPCPEHPAADENTGFLGRYLAQELDCHSIIACYYPTDVNKSWNTDYASQLLRWSPKVLVEVHGHKEGSAWSDVEISPGRKENEQFSRELADRLLGGCAKDEALKWLTICGELERIRFKAKGTATIVGGDWIAYHIELPPALRKSSAVPQDEPPEIGYRFCNLLANALREMHPSPT